MRKKHTQSFKLQAVEKALSRSEHQTLGQLAEQLGIGYSTLTRWMLEVKLGKLTEESVPMAKSKRPADWTAQEKLQAILDTERLSEQDKGRYCRQKGLYQQKIEQWKEQLMSKPQNNNEQTQQYKAQIKALKEENQRLQKELARKEKALAEAAALMVLKKKAQALFGSDEEA